MILTITDLEGRTRPYTTGCTFRVDTWNKAIEVHDPHGNFVEIVTEWSSYTVEND